MDRSALAAMLEDDSPWARAAYMNANAAKPAGGRKEGLATALLDALGSAPMQKLAGMGQAIKDYSANEFPATYGATEQSADFDPRQRAADWSAGTAMNVVGTPAMTGGVPADAMGSAAKGIRAYHGSPHDFDRFDLSKIGTGEGAQAYGHGLYFAENEATAKAYREALAGQAANPARNEEMKLLAREMDKYAIPGAYRQYSDPRGYDLAKQYDALMEARAADKGRMYEVNINAHPDQFLDWHKPLNQQPAGAREAIEKLIAPAGTNRMYDEKLLAAPTKSGGYEYKADGGKFIQEFGSDSRMSNALREAGIPGIKYLDQGSRNPGFSSLTPTQLDARIDTLRADIAGGGGNQAVMKDKLAGLERERASYDNLTSNYVVFDDKLIDILKKYGIAGLPASQLGQFLDQPQDAASQ